MRSASQSGFSLIELIMVIVILGILSAVAVPRFTDLGGNARQAAVRSWAGTIRSAMGMAHATALATGATGAAATVTVDNLAIDLVNGYPAATATGITRALSNTDPGEISVVYGTGSATFTPNGAATPAQCQVTYTEGTPPAIALATGGC